MRHHLLDAAVMTLWLILTGCSSDPGASEPQTAGTGGAATGGTSATGGASATGGGNATGGTSATGGTGATGGTSATGGASGTGGEAGSESDCEVSSIQKLPTEYENFVVHQATGLMVVSQQDANGIYQIYSGVSEANLTCISCVQVPGGPPVDRHKMMVNIHPNGKWIVLGVEETVHENEWMPESWQIGLLQSGVWLNIWMTTPTGDHWYQITDYKPANGPSNGFVGVGFINGGTTAMWTEIVDGNVLVNKFGVWKLFTADFSVTNGVPSFSNKKDITPSDALWIEPGNMHPDGRHLLISTDIGFGVPRDAQGQDQWSLDVVSGDLEQLTNTPTVWDEHGLYSPDGKKIAFMSSYPYKDDPTSYQTFSLRTEFMLMNADGTGLQQLTHFNVPGYPESQSGNTVAAVAGFTDDGTALKATVMAPEFGKTNWEIAFKGPCGMHP